MTPAPTRYEIGTIAARIVAAPQVSPQVSDAWACPAGLSSLLAMAKRLTLVGWCHVETLDHGPRAVERPGIRGAGGGAARGRRLRVLRWRGRGRVDAS